MSAARKSAARAIMIQRAYDEPTSHDGYRVLVDHFWPRGRSKEVLKLDEWARDIAPSAELIHWFGHDPARWEEFQKRYRAELAGCATRAPARAVHRSRQATHDPGVWRAQRNGESGRGAARGTSRVRRALTAPVEDS